MAGRNQPVHTKRYNVTLADDRGTDRIEADLFTYEDGAVIFWEAVEASKIEVVAATGERGGEQQGYLTIKELYPLSAIVRVHKLDDEQKPEVK